MSFALFEAMARSLPVIAADSPGAPEVIGDAGQLLATGQESALVERLKEVSAHPALRASLGARAKTRALQELSAASSVWPPRRSIASPRPPPSLSGGSLRHVGRSPTPDELAVELLRLIDPLLEVANRANGHLCLGDELYSQRR